MRERRATSEQVVGGGRQRVLVGPAVERFAHQLLRRRVRDGSDCHVGRGQAHGVVISACNPEVGQQDPLLGRIVVGDQDVGGLHVPVQ